MKRKICIVTRNLLSGGAERVISQLANYFVSDENVECSIVTLYKADLFYTIDDRVKIHQIDVKVTNGIMDKLLRYKAFRQFVMETKPDIILAMPEEIGIYAIAAVMGTGIPIVVSERNNPWVMPNKKITRILRKILYPMADGFVFQTQKAASFFSKSIQRKGIVLKNPLELARIPSRYLGDRKKEIVSVGRLEEQKNFRVLIDAFVIVQQVHPEYRLTIWGEGRKRSELEAYAAHQLPKGKWSFPGRSDNVLNDIRDSACFVLSSDYEGVPNALIEALAMGIPCVSTDCEPGGARELISNGNNGWIVPIKDVNALAEKICFMIDHPEEAEKMGSRGLEVKEEFNVAMVGKKWLEYLEQNMRSI